MTSLTYRSAKFQKTIRTHNYVKNTIFIGFFVDINNELMYHQRHPRTSVLPDIAIILRRPAQNGFGQLYSHARGICYLGIRTERDYL